LALGQDSLPVSIKSARIVHANFFNEVNEDGMTWVARTSSSARPPWLSLLPSVKFPVSGFGNVSGRATLLRSLVGFARVGRVAAQREICPAFETMKQRQERISTGNRRRLKETARDAATLYQATAQPHITAD
jgi:hypothetical protein